MRTAKLVRQPSTDQGTFGVLTVDNGDRFYSGELPWRDNHADLSCIPPGDYICSLFDSPKHGLVFRLQNVPHRSDIEIHSMNYFGDVIKGYKAESKGCIGLGTDEDVWQGQRVIIHSKAALQLFMNEMGSEDFALEII